MKLLLCMVCVLLGVGCEVKEAEVVAVSVDHDSLRPMYHLDGFDCREILLELIHSDGRIEKVPLETSMIELSDQAKLLEAGAHVLNVEVYGLDTVLPVNLYQTDYDYELINLYIQGIHQSVIKDLSYEEWLLSIEGTPGIHMVDASLNEAGHLILTMSDGMSHDLGVIEGTDGLDGVDGLDGLNIELDVKDNAIMWRYEELEWTPLVSLSELRGYRGFTGARGADGTGISETSIQPDGVLKIIYTDGTSDSIDLLGTSYSVIYQDAHGSILDIQTVLKGTAVTPPKGPALDGHTFLRWSETVESIQNHHVIKPVYERNTLTVSFDVQGGSPVDPVTVKYGDQISLPTPEKAGYIFDGWAFGDGLNDQRFTDQESVLESHTLVALWERPLLTVVFVDEEKAPLKTAYTYPDGIVTPPEAVTKVGHTFTGWSHTSVGITEDVLIEPVFEVNTYTLTLHETTVIPHGGPFQPGETFIKVEAGAYHSGALTSDGRIIMWGDNSHGQLGTGTAVTSHDGLDITGRFELIENETMIDIALGHSHGLALTSDHRIFTWGYNFYGQLGNGTYWTQEKPVDISRHFPDDLVIKEVFASMHHSAFITDTNEIYTWGDNAYGQLAHEDVLKVRFPAMINSLSLDADETILDFAVGGTHMGVLTDQITTYMWGLNTSYQLAYIKTGSYATPRRQPHGYLLNPDEHLLNLELGHNHTGFITSQGRLLMVGNNASGQLGIGSTTSKYVPTEVNLPMDLDTDAINTLILGNEVSFITTNLGDIYAFGTNVTSQLTGDNAANQTIPLDITASFDLNEEAPQLAASQLKTAGFGVLMTDQDTYVWGDNSLNQLSDDITNPASDPIQRFETMTESSIYEVPYGISLNEFLDADSSFTWYIDETFTTPYDGHSMGAEDLTLYGQME